VDDRSRIALSALLGAVAGAAVGFLYLTEEGRRVRERLGPGMDDVAQEVRRLRSTMDSARAATREGWAAIEDLRRGLADAGGQHWTGPVRPPRPY
jgi:hypothetical protein